MQHHKFIILEGWPAAGKSCLWALLDGHEEIFVEPVHTYFYQVIFTLFSNEYEERTISIREFRKALSDTEYYKLEQISATGYYEMTASHSSKMSFKFEFNFQSFDLENIKFLENGTRKLTAASLLSHMIRNFYVSYGKTDHPRFFVGMSNYFMYRKSNLTEFPSLFKVITILREPVEIYASRVSRLPRLEDGSKNTDFSPSKKKLAREAEIEEIMAFNRYHMHRALHLSDQYHVLFLDELLVDKPHHLNKICSFLEIEKSNDMLIGSRDGLKFESENFSLTSSINDSSLKLISKPHMLYLNIRKVLFLIHKLPVNILNIYSILRFSYLKIKGYR